MGFSMSSSFLVKHAGESTVQKDQALPPNLVIASSRRPAAAMANVKEIQDVRQQKDLKRKCPQYRQKLDQQTMSVQELLQTSVSDEQYFTPPPLIIY